MYIRFSLSCNNCLILNSYSTNSMHMTSTRTGLSNYNLFITNISSIFSFFVAYYYIHFCRLLIHLVRNSESEVDIYICQYIHTYMHKSQISIFYFFFEEHFIVLLPVFK